MTDTGVVEITGIAAGGAGVGRLPDGRVSFVHRTAPGDEVEVRVREEHGRWTRADLIRVRRPAPGRRPPPCPLYDRCGGCTLQHMRYDVQLDAKRALVEDALRRIGGITSTVEGVIPSPLELRYRNRIALTLLRLGGERVVAGFHELERPGRIVDVAGACLLPEPDLVETWTHIREHWGPGARLLPAGRRLRLTLRGTSKGRAAMLVEGGHGTGDGAALIAAVPALAAVWHRPRRSEPARLLAGIESLDEHWLEEDVGLRGDAFLQVNRSAAELMEAAVEASVLASQPARAVDAYCGVGLYARRLARAGVCVVGIEADANAVAEARRGCAECRILEGRVEARIGETLPADVVILNPPRAGLAENVVHALLEQPPARVVYVSCDPATLARDLARMARQYRAARMRCFDLFPQTAHVETVVELECVTT